MSPKAMALSYRIWAFAEPKGWDCTAAEIAEVLGAAPADIRPDLAAFAARPRPDDERPLVGATPDTDPSAVTK